MNVCDELLERMRAGDDEAYKQFVSDHWQQALRTAWMILQNIHDAEEAAQDAFVNAYRHLGQLQDGAYFGGWFYQTLINATRLRKKRQQRELRTSPYTESYEENFESKSDTRLQVVAALGQLRQPERIAMVLRYY